MRLRLLPLALMLALLSPAAAAQKLAVVASFSILADLARNVGGDRVTVTSLVPADADAHTYQVSARDARSVADARVVFLNGEGFDSWADRLLSGTKARVVRLSDGRPKLESEHGDEEHGEHEGEDHDPHLWWDLRYAITYVKTIGATLAAVDPAGRATYEANTARYARTLASLDTWALEQVKTVPEARRKIVTNHDALGYLANRYGLTVVGTVFPGGGTESNPSARETAELVRAIRAAGVRAIFTENTLNPSLARTVAAETGAVVAPPLYTDALGKPETPGATFVGAFRHNVTTIVAALKR